MPLMGKKKLKKYPITPNGTTGEREREVSKNGAERLRLTYILESYRKLGTTWGDTNAAG